MRTPTSRRILSFLALVLALLILNLNQTSGHRVYAADPCPVAFPAFDGTEGTTTTADGGIIKSSNPIPEGASIKVFYKASSAVQSQSQPNDWIVRVDSDIGTSEALSDVTVGPPNPEHLWSASLGATIPSGDHSVSLIYRPTGTVCDTQGFHVSLTADSSKGIFSGILDPLHGRFSSFGEIASKLAPFILALGGMVAFLFLIWGGIKYMLSQGDPKAVTSARSTIVSAIIGLIILASVFVILQLINLIFKIPVLGATSNQVFAANCSYQLSTNQIAYNGSFNVTTTVQGSNYYTISFNPGNNNKIFMANIAETSHTETINIGTFYTNPPTQITVTVGHGIPSQHPAPCDLQGSNEVTITPAPNPTGGNNNDGNDNSTTAKGGINIGDAFKFGTKGVKDVFPNFGVLLTSVVNFAIAAAGLIFFFMLVWGGMRYMLARGDDKLIVDARQTVTNAVIGLLIVVASFAIIKLIALATGAHISIF